MYAATVDLTTPAHELSSLLVTLLSDLNLGKLEIMCREFGYDPWPYNEILLPRDSDILYNALEFLRTDEGFFTLSCKYRALIVPFEGNHFNLITTDEVVLPRIEGLHLKDATDVLLQYSDAYEGYGLNATFGGNLDKGESPESN